MLSLSPSRSTSDPEGRADALCPIRLRTKVVKTRHLVECGSREAIQGAVGIGYNRPGLHRYLGMIGKKNSWLEKSSLLVPGRMYEPS